MVSSRHTTLGPIVAMMHVFVLPPSESRSKRVSLESLAPCRQQGYSSDGYMIWTLTKHECQQNTNNSGSEVTALPVRHMSRVFHQCCDDSAQGQQTLVDVTSLSSSVVFGTRPVERQQMRTIPAAHDTSTSFACDTI
jgi:hypothetical protein